MDTWIDLVGAIAWPLVVCLALVVFRKPLRSALNNATQVRIAGQEIHIARERLDMLGVLIQRMEQAENLERSGREPALRRRILDRAEAEPLVAVLDLDSAIVDAVRDLALTNGWVDDLEHGPRELWYLLLQAHQLGQSSPDALPALFLYSELEDAVLKGHLKLGLADMLRIIKFGLQIHTFVLTIPRRVNIVLRSGMPIYNDRECLDRRQDIKGVLIHLQKPGEVPEEGVWPSNRHYEPGTQVSWIFDDSHSWQPCWWRNDETGEVVHVWKGTRYSFDGDPLPQAKS